MHDVDTLLLIPVESICKGLIIIQLCPLELLRCLLQISRAITLLMGSMYDISRFMLGFDVSATWSLGIET